MRRLARRLYFWVLVGIVTGCVLGIVGARDGGQAEAAQRRLHQPGEDADRPDRLPDGGPRRLPVPAT